MFCKVKFWTNVFSSVDITLHQWRNGAEEIFNYQQSLPGQSFDIVTVKVKHQVSIFWSQISS